jgi:hypothetical protein
MPVPQVLRPPMAAVTAVAGERGGHYGMKAADTSRACPARRPGFAAGGPSITLRNVVNGPSTTLLCSQRPIHHVGERSQRAIDLPGIREAPSIWGWGTERRSFNLCKCAALTRTRDKYRGQLGASWVPPTGQIAIKYNTEAIFVLRRVNVPSWLME